MGLKIQGSILPHPSFPPPPDYVPSVQTTFPSFHLLTVQYSTVCIKHINCYIGYFMARTVHSCYFTHTHTHYLEPWCSEELEPDQVNFYSSASNTGTLVFTITVLQAHVQVNWWIPYSIFPQGVVLLETKHITSSSHTCNIFKLTWGVVAPVWSDSLCLLIGPV